MNRKSLIIYSFGPEDGQDFRSGIYNDANHFFKFQRSSNGGAWKKDSEIVALKNPSKVELYRALEDHDGADLSYVFFAGHGISPGGKDHISINGKDTIPIQVLFRKAKRQVVIIDACRNNPWSNFIGGLGSPGGFMFDYSHKYFARGLYNKLVSQSSEGRVLLYAGSPNESSYSDETGGAFSKSMFNGLQNFALQPDKNFLSVHDVFKKAKSATSHWNEVPPGQQNPQIYRLGQGKGHTIPMSINYRAYLSLSNRQVQTYRQHSPQNQYVSYAQTRGQGTGAGLLVGGLILAGLALALASD